MIGRRRRPEVDIAVQPAAQRYVSEQAGITSWHSFSAGSHYDPDNVAFGALVGVDEHLLEPGAGFERHAHRGVDIVTYVLEGTVRHEDTAGHAHVLRPGDVAVQVAGTGIEHVEQNASSTEPVRFVQITLTAGEGRPDYRVASPPRPVAGALFDVHRSGPLLLEARRAHLLCVRGAFTVDRYALGPGDCARISDHAPKIDGSGELLVVLLR